MNTIGQILKSARVEKNISLLQLENLTKIKRNFIESIEEERWNDLPAFPTVFGFVKSISTTLNVDQKMTSAILKRDYPPKKIRLIPKPDLSTKFSWNPKFTFILGMVSAILVVFGYLIYQYIHFISPPRLYIDSPKDGQVVNGSSVAVFGTTDSDAKITINNQPVMVSEDGKFSVSLDVVSSTREVVITASARSGKITTVARKILVSSN